jgi:membrane-associated protease RseP (regulator of RpoE activity)
MRRILFGLIALTLTAPLRADDSRSTSEKPVKVPFTLMPSGHFIVSVKLNGKGPYKLIFDTGAPTMLINNRIAKESGVVDPKAAKPLFSPFGAGGPTTIKELQVGDVKATKVSAMVMDHPTVEAFSKFFKKEHGSIDGIVGFPFFARFKMTVDYQAKELTFVPNDYVPADIIQSMMKLMTGTQKNEPKIAAPGGHWGITVKKETSDEDAGVTITTVAQDSPAAKAGLKEGDRLLTVDGRWTDSVPDTYQAASFVKVGKPIPVVVSRGGKEFTLQLTPAKGL